MQELQLYLWDEEALALQDASKESMTEGLAWAITLFFHMKDTDQVDWEEQKNSCHPKKAMALSKEYVVTIEPVCRLWGKLGREG